MLLGLVALFAFTGCEKFPCNDSHKVSELAGTWTCLQENFAEALVIKANGSVVSTGVEDGEYWENVKGNIAIHGGKIAMTFEDDDNSEGHFDFIPGIAFSITSDKGERYTYNYCKEDLSDAIVGMWVATGGPYMSIETFNEDGSTIYTGFVPESDEIVLNSDLSYKVVGDLQFHTVAVESSAEDQPLYVVHRLIYSPYTTTSLGDIMTWQVSDTISFARLRIKQNLDFAVKEYDYSNVYVTNVKGQDKDFEFAGHTLNFSTLNGRIMDKMLKHLLFNVSFPSANKINYNCFFNGETVSIKAPILVDGNKVTIKMSELNSAYRDVDMYTFQDVDNTQMHMYMPVTSFTNFFSNVSIVAMAKKGQLDLNDKNAVTEIYNKVDNAIETINVSFIFKQAK
jgi:hypothetical protein